MKNHTPFRFACLAAVVMLSSIQVEYFDPPFVASLVVSFVENPLKGTGRIDKDPDKFSSGRNKAVAMPALCSYTACTMSMQYTIRAVPSVIDRALRRRAKLEAKSLNAVVVEVLGRGLELDAKVVEHNDLDALIGSWQEDPGFDRAMADFERVDEEEWK